MFNFLSLMAQNLIALWGFGWQSVFDLGFLNYPLYDTSWRSKLELDYIDKLNIEFFKVSSFIFWLFPIFVNSSHLYSKSSISSLVYDWDLSDIWNLSSSSSFSICLFFYIILLFNLHNNFACLSWDCSSF